MADVNPEDRGPVLTTMEARQGRRGRHVLWILVISLAAIVIGYGVMVVGVQNTHLASAGGQTRIDRQTLNETEGAANTPLQQPEQKSSGITPGIGSDGKGL